MIRLPVVNAVPERDRGWGFASLEGGAAPGRTGILASVNAGIGYRLDDRREARLDPDLAVNDRRRLLLMAIRDVVYRAPLAQEIFDEIAVAVVQGQLAPGETLNSVDLATRFGTSRTPVREALAELERHGVVVVPPRRRPYVAVPTLKDVDDVYRLRAALAGLTSELIVEKASAEGVAELRRWLDALEDDVRRGSVDDYFWHNVGFRLLEVRLADNSELQRVTSALGVRTLQFRHLSLSHPGRIEWSAVRHRRLVDAYEQKDLDVAVAVARELVMGGYESIKGMDSDALGLADTARQSGDQG